MNLYFYYHFFAGDKLHLSGAAKAFSNFVLINKSKLLKSLEVLKIICLQDHALFQSKK